MPCYSDRQQETKHDEHLKLAPSREMLHDPSSLPVMVNLVPSLLHCLIRCSRLLILRVGITLTTFLIGDWWRHVCLIALFISFKCISRLWRVLHQRCPLLLQPARCKPEAETYEQKTEQRC